MYTDFKEIEKILTLNGWILVRVNGSHFCYKKPDSCAILVIPCTSSKNLSSGIVRHLENTTGLSFER